MISLLVGSTANKEMYTVDVNKLLQANCRIAPPRVDYIMERLGQNYRLYWTYIVSIIQFISNSEMLKKKEAIRRHLW